MSARTLSSRLKALERAARTAAPVCLWLDEGETPARAAARRFPDGPPAGAPLLFFRWQSSDGAQA